VLSVIAPWPNWPWGFFCWTCSRDAGRLFLDFVDLNIGCGGTHFDWLCCFRDGVQLVSLFGDHCVGQSVVEPLLT